MRFFGCETLTSEQGKAMLEHHGFQVQEEMRIGGYDLLLVYHVPTRTYHLAIQRVGNDFTSIEQQKSRIPASLAALPSEFYPAIAYWIQRHGQLYMASHDQRKSQSYPRILRRLGFEVTQTEFCGVLLHTVSLK